MATIALEIGLNVATPRGIDTYYAGLLDSLSRLDPGNRYLAFTFFWRDYDAKRARLPIPRTPQFEGRVPRWPESVVGWLEKRLALPIVDRLFARPAGVEIYHGMGGHLPPLSRAAGLVTIHDLIPEVFYERDLTAGRTPEIIPSGVTGLSSRRAERVIAISQSTKRDLMRFYSVPEEKIDIVYPAVDHRAFVPAEEPARRQVLERHGLTSPYWLFMGPFERRRNAERALEGVARAEPGASGRTLAFIGSRNAAFERVEAKARELGLLPRVKVLGRVDRADLPALYGGADAFVHASLYEGFCSPVVEAMACGAAVITSNVSALPEVAGDGALTVDPESADALADAFRRLMSEPERRALREKGKARAAVFTWDRCAEKTLEVYRKLGAK